MATNAKRKNKEERTIGAIISYGEKAASKSDNKIIVADALINLLSFQKVLEDQIKSVTKIMSNFEGNEEVLSESGSKLSVVPTFVVRKMNVRDVKRFEKAKAEKPTRSRRAPAKATAAKSGTKKPRRSKAQIEKDALDHLTDTGKGKKGSSKIIAMPTKGKETRVPHAKEN